MGSLRDQVAKDFAHLTRNGDDGCLVWTGCKDKKGYGKVCREKTCQNAHRYIYRVYKGAIEEGHTVDHLCRNRACVNPDHLEAVPHIINVRRGTTGITNLSKTHCPKGHEYSRVNKQGSRICKTCIRDNMRLSRSRRREAQSLS